ncbi:Cytochrome c oxidase assembly protein COX15 [Orchesella cincta]|uniref:Cytochrome c oxidase assembly protein COX15 n=1 Tax=Orchesella cincta TaxID=48709 RepID=A0A1D2M8G2_ORCCI|nr:Cytochrome c oxidase assembly protein COX15 [Orchesella cincta]
MVSWKLFGEKPPLSETDWEVEFKRYQEYPEFKIKNKDISLDDFKTIWRMEYLHRMWGRGIGAVFYIPAGIMWYKGFFSKVMKRRVVILGALLAFQGLLGWYMVKSGLEDRFHGESDTPRVSQYRLAAHLGSAFVLYSLFLSTALGKLAPPQTFERTEAILRFRKVAHCAKGLVFLTAISGAFVAGLDAGLVYNSFPKMADKWIPDDILALDPAWKNFTENPTTVQFDHRILGITTFSTIMGLWALSRKTRLPRRATLAANLLAVVAIAQVTLGITTLLNYVPTHLQPHTRVDRWCSLA